MFDKNMANFIRAGTFSYFNITDGNTISDNALADMERNHIGLFGEISVTFDGEEIPGRRTFYDVMVDHPRFKEFLQKDVNKIIGTFAVVGDHTENPEVLSEFAALLMTILTKYHTNLPFMQDIEEFLDHRANIKSAKK